MTRPSDSELVALLLTQRLVDASAPPLKASEFWALVESVDDLGGLLGCGPEEVSKAARVDASTGARIVALLDAATGFAFALDDAQQRGLRVMSGVSADFPALLTERLGRAAPPVLYAFGDVSLLGRPALGVVGSRAVSDAGALAGREAAAAIVAAGFGVVSGGAKGVDRLAMNAAVDAGGHVVGVLADSLVRAAREPEMRRAVTDGTVCLCSPYKPTAGFTVASAMGRNKIIYALSTATLVVECEEGSGGSWAGAVEALRARTTPVLAWTGEGASPGNLALVRRGAHAVDRLERLFPLPSVEGLPTADQLALGL
jgi:predicted Rossmann fold nucleotide-binding protein DprA/Smf involved in DNA uptake